MATAQPARTAADENFEALLASPRLAGAPALLREAVLRLLFESEHYAFTQITRTGRASDGRDATGTVERFDPSRAPGEEWTLVTLRGATPSPADFASWRERKQRAGASPWSLEDFFDFAHAEPEGEDYLGLQFRVPLGRAAKGMFPRELVLALIKVSREQPRVLAVRVVSRPESAGGGTRIVSRNAAGETTVRVVPRKPAGTSQAEQELGTGALLIFLQKNAAPPPALLLVLGATGVTSIAADGFREVKWTDCRRVPLYDERFIAKIGPLRTIDFE